MSEADDGIKGWASAVGVAALVCVDPLGLGGVRLRARPGYVRDAWLRIVRELLPRETPWQRLPANIRDDRLLGGLDLTATLRAGHAVAQRGVLAQAHEGVLEIAMAERLDGAIAAKICATVDSGVVALEREGLASRPPARFTMIALDEGDEQFAEAPPASLCDRLGFIVDLHHISWRDVSEGWLEADRLAQARNMAAQVAVTQPQYDAVAAAAVALGVWSLRPTLYALRAARAAAALEQRTAVNDDDLSLAVQLVLAPRATCVPAPPEDAEEPAPPARQDASDAEPEDAPEDPPDGEAPDAPADDSPEHAGALDEQVLAAAAAAIPQDVLRAIAAQSSAAARTAGGKAGAVMKSTRRGRPVGSTPGVPADGARLAVLDTLRAAAPWQRLRQRERPSKGPAPSVSVRSEDFRVLRFRQHSPTTTIFLVDASGSAALHRLAEAKGAIELLLAECYVRRDEVAMIAFRGREASVLLPPTRSLVRAKRELAALPGGGGTPLACGLDAARHLIEQIKRDGQTPFLVVLTDGRANVTREGVGGRQQAHADAIASAKALAEESVQTVLIDVSRKPQPQAGQVAQALGARYLPLPNADASKLSDAIQHAAPQRA